VAKAVDVADRVLAPDAQFTDQAERVPATNLEALARAGLYGLFGGAQAPAPATTRAVFEALAGACGATFFVWVQHHAPVRMLAASANADLRERWLTPLRAGEVLGGVAFAHLRRPDPPAVVAQRRAGGGWRLTGEAPWVTSWGLAEVFAVAARWEDRVVFFALPASAPGLEPSSALRLLAMSATSTVRLGFRDVALTDGDVIEDRSFREWQEHDRSATAQPHPAAFGVAAACLSRLTPLEPATAGALQAEWEDCRAQSYASAGGVGLRAWSLELALRCAYGLVAATGGRAMELSHPAQRLLREASFYAIQAQTRALRQATLECLTR
jgi:alkylation response protein AidB-like acyl-CoA dehydrogenase